MKSVVKENADVKKDQKDNLEKDEKLDVTVIGMPDEALLWERKFRKQGKSV
jgi:hypothetical protein